MLNTELAAGYDLDELVAKAIGIRHQRAGGAYVQRCADEPVFLPSGIALNNWPKFRPSTDWNDAMLAAERFSGFDLWRLNKTEHGYYMACLCHGDDGWSAFTTCDTGPLAVCSAIILIGR